MKRIFELVLVFALFSSGFACLMDMSGDNGDNRNGGNRNGDGNDYSNYLDYSEESFESKEESTASPESTEEPEETTETEEPSIESTTPDDSSKQKQIDDLKDQVDDNAKWVELIPCIFLSCSFEKGSMCMYRNLGPPARPQRDGPSGPLSGSHKGQPSPQDFSETEDAVDLESALDGLEVADSGVQRTQKRKMKLTRRRLPENAYSWQAVTGRFGNRITGVRRAAEGQYYSAAYIRPNQQAAFEARVLRLSEDIKISFQAYEGVAGMRMQVCCETKEPLEITTCGFETKEFVGPMGYHEWMPVEAICPAGTERIIFICKNLDKHQGACAVDDIKVTGEQCPQFTAKANAVLPRGRKH